MIGHGAFQIGTKSIHYKIMSFSEEFSYWPVPMIQTLIEQFSIDQNDDKNSFIYSRYSLTPLTID